MYQTLNAEWISRALFETDPMHTCCVENECLDEYDRVAVTASEYIKQGYSLSQALHQALCDSFGLELAAGRDLSPILARLQPLLVGSDMPSHSEHYTAIEGPPYKEYLETFSDSGPIKVKVKFDQGPSWIGERRMRPDEITSLIDPETGGFVTVMSFDDHPHEITRIDLSLVRKTLTIYARAPELASAKD